MVISDIVFKFTVVGNSGVGKSALCTQFADKRFLPDHRELTLDTHRLHILAGVDVVSRNITIGGSRVKLQTWDTNGQERFLSITRSYFRGSAGVLLVYDITNRESFEKLTKWLDNIHECSNNKHIVIYLIGNKSDMDHKRVVKQSEGEEFMRKHGLAGFLETSAKTASNVEVAFTDMAIEIYEMMNAGVFDTSNQANGVRLIPQRYTDQPVAAPKQKCNC